MSSGRSRSGGTVIGKTVEPVGQVLPERAVGDGALEIAVGGGNHTHVDVNRTRAAQALDLPLLQHAQQLDLNVARQFADFVEKNGGVVGDFESTDLPGRGAGVGPLLPPEQLALDQSLRNGGAVHPDHRAAGPRAPVVDGRRDQLLARAGLAEEQNRRAGRRHLLDLLQDPAHDEALARDLPRSPAGLRFIPQVDVFAGQPVPQPRILRKHTAELGLGEFSRERIGEHLADETETVDDVGRPRPFGSQGAERERAHDPSRDDERHA